jgi:hypothetical protein
MFKKFAHGILFFSSILSVRSSGLAYNVVTSQPAPWSESSVQEHQRDTSITPINSSDAALMLSA